MMNEVILIRSLWFWNSWLRDKNNDTVNDGRRGVALHPGAEVGSRMLMSILVRVAQLMVELKGRNEHRKGD
jgi:hypothetical protein